MYSDIPAFEAPSDRTSTVWRYMNVKKFRDLVTSRSLYMARADRFADQFEGLLSVPTRNQNSSVAEWIRDARSQSYVSCWQLNTHESAHMWEQYLRENQGVVVETEFQRLTASFGPCKEAVFIGLIHYIDYDSAQIIGWDRTINIYQPIMHKRLEYQSDKEVRIVLNTMSNTALHAKANDKQGLSLPINIDVLVKRVRLMPGASSELQREIHDLVSNAGLECEVATSSLDRSPP
ncbi:hypothetical protein [Gimesia maris]|uniref:hypothetical protein n=1 Tax=Gimesia maris TaxID=122 RepID=UPI003A8CE9F5